MTRVGVVVLDWKVLRTLPDDARVKAWGWPETAGRVKASMRERLHLKISSKLSWYNVGRKWDDTYQRELLRDCWNIREKVTKRVRLYQIMTPELRRRYQHLLDDRNEM